MSHRGFVSVSSSAKSKRGLRPSLQVTIGTGQRCPFCHEHLHTEEPLLACAECLTVFHEACVDEGEACTTMGCGRSRAEPPQQRSPRSTPAEGAGRPAFTAAAFVLAFAGLGLASWAALRPPSIVIVQPPPAPQPVPFHAPYVLPHVVNVSDGPRLDLAFDSISTNDGTVTIRGIAYSDGPVELTFSSTCGEVTLRQGPGPFVGSVTVGPGAGTHQAVVRLRDAHGREAVAVMQVEYAPR